MTWTYEADSIRISLSKWWEHGDERTADDWRARGWLIDRDLVVPVGEWIAAGQPPRVGEDDAARLEAWRTDHDRLARLIGVDAQRVHVRSVGHFLASGLELEVSTDEGTTFSRVGHSSLWLSAHRPVAPAAARALELAERIRDSKGDDRYRELHQLKWLAKRLAQLTAPIVTLQLDEHLESIEVEEAERIALSWEAEGDKAQVVTLRMEAVFPDGRRQPLDPGHVNAGGVSTAATKQPVILPPAVNELLPAVRARKREPRRRRESELASPAMVLPEGADLDAFIDLSQYATRVSGFERVERRDAPPPAEGQGIDWFAAPDPEYFLSVHARRADGGTETIRLSTRAEAEQFAVSARAAAAQKRPRFPHAGRELAEPEKALAAVEPLLASTAEPVQETETDAKGPAPERWAAILKPLNADASGDAELQIDEQRVPWHQLEQLLRPNVQLKPHQRQGLAWMWGHLSNGTRGVLLADDMGLGKTLQVSALLALARATTAAPQRPHLVVCPTVLLDNWSRELARFFVPTAFGATLTLHGATLKGFRKEKGLDIDRLAQHGTVITNYDTLASHQLSLLKVDWDLVVFDEAQWIKNETTLRARGAAGLKRRFGVALTGTPVENRLSDVWAIFDALEHEPPRTFGTKADFVAQFERSDMGIDRVRQALLFPSEKSRLFRREKAQALRDLPPKVMHELPTPMSEQQFSHERTLLRERRRRSALELIQQLQFLYQHPLLLSNKEPWDYSVAELIDMSPKLDRTCGELERIRTAGERAIVFTQFKRMQDILVRVIRQRFDLPVVPVINGDEANREAAQRNIDWFMGVPHFAVMVLSPLAAGIGLTITAANHVIHYGRWWNPAKEEQATDRAHRIGQTRTVHVYYPTLHHPNDPQRGFDRKLHELVERKRAVARDFLRPADELELDESEAAAACEQEAPT